MNPVDPRLDRAPCGYLSMTDNHVIQSMNATLLDMLEYGHDELPHRNLLFLLKPPSRAMFQIYFMPLIKLNGIVEEMYLTLRTKSGGNLPVLLNASRSEKDDDAVNACVLIPLRRRMEYEQQIQTAERAAEKANVRLERALLELERIRIEMELLRGESSRGTSGLDFELADEFPEFDGHHR